MQSERPSVSRHTTLSRKLDSCKLCGQELERRVLVTSASLRPAQFEHIAARHPEWSHDAWICGPCLARERLDFQMSRMAAERGELSEVETEIAHKAFEHLTLAEDIEQQFQTQITLGQRLADRVATVGGSWPFVLGFFGVLLLWVGVNSIILRGTAFDPYPYILLNLVLSCLAAIQAPIIMMSQNRLSARDRLQANQDFRINLKAELEVSSLHEKVDHLLHSQWQHMVELQELQIDLLTELASRDATK
jgi:uncharacterized membrane protein